MQATQAERGTPAQRNVLRGAVINGPGLSDFCARFVDADGKPIRDMRLHLPPEVDARIAAIYRRDRAITPAGDAVIGAPVAGAVDAGAGVAAPRGAGRTSTTVPGAAARGAAPCRHA